MTPKQYEEIRAVYVAASRLPVADRASYLDSACADDALRSEVQRLLDDSTNTDFLETPALGKPVQFDTTPLAGETVASAATRAESSHAIEELPEEIGGYQIIELLGQGGMGTVYLARQENPQREVALKVMRAGTASSSLLRRFRHEAEILGRLQHPGIAQIHEAGTAKTAAGTQPYFAMERVVGTTLTKYAADEKPDLRTRVALLADVADAVQHAHQKGVIHRDLKPANILIDDRGRPKILDFGVARLVDDNAATVEQTQAGALIGTIPYMSPEQIAGGRDDLDTRSDVYSLGVVAFELLCGNLPHNVREKSVYEAARTIRDDEPTRLASHNRALRGDLETIIATALEKDPERRYQSAAVFAEDLRRYLRHEPITARPATAWYQLRKIARRHRAAFVGVTALFAALILGAFGTSYGLLRAKENERRATAAAIEARTAAAQASEVSTFLRGMMSAADPEKVAGINLTVRDVLDEAALRVRTEPPSDPTVAVMVHTTLADTYRGLGAMDTAQQHIDEANRILAGAANVSVVTRAELAHVSARIRLDEGRYEPALEHLDEELALLEAAETTDYWALANCHARRANAFTGLTDYEKANAAIDTAQQIRAREYGEQSVSYAEGLAMIGRLHRTQANFVAAHDMITRAIEIFEQANGPTHPTVAKSKADLAGLKLDQGDPAAAVEIFREVVDIYRAAYGAEHHAVASGLNNYATAQIKIGRIADAIDNFAEAARLYRKVLPQNKAHLGIILQNRASLLINAGRLEEAETGLRDALAVLREGLPENSPSIASALNTLGGALRKMRRYDEAEAAYQEALAIREAAYGREHPTVATTLSNIAWLKQSAGDYDGAVRLQKEALALRRQIFPAGHPDIAHSLAGLARIWIDQGKLRDGLEAVRESAAIRREALGPRSWTTIRTLLMKQEVLRRLEKFDAAGQILDEINDVMLEFESDFSPAQRAAVLRQRAELHEASGDLAAAEKIRDELRAAGQSARGN